LARYGGVLPNKKYPMEQEKCLSPCQRSCSCAGISLTPPVRKGMDISIFPHEKRNGGHEQSFHIEKGVGLGYPPGK